MVGDSINDFAVGRNAETFTVGLRAGYYKPGEPDPHVWLDDVVALDRWLTDLR